jgi:hypothetical protein
MELVRQLENGKVIKADVVDRYNPGNLPMMEDYLREQMEQGEQDLLANLAVLKL